jgi:ATP dependent DNA ligase domain
MTTAWRRLNNIRHHRNDDRVFLYGFDLIELNGDDLRRNPLQVRKATLASILTRAGAGIQFNEHIEGDGPTVFAHACKLGLEGIESKRKGCPAGISQIAPVTHSCRVVESGHIACGAASAEKTNSPPVSSPASQCELSFSNQVEVI